MKVTIFILEDGKSSQQRTFEPGVYRIGRSDFCDLVLAHENVSRSQLEIRITETSVYATNMSRAGKVKLRGRPIETSEIKEGDEIQIGPFTLQFTFKEVEPALEVPNGEENLPPAEAEPNLPIDGNLALQESPFAVADDPNIPDLKLVEDAPAQEPQPSFANNETFVEMKPLVAKLTFTEGPREGEDFKLEAYEISLGRSKKADIYINDEKLSRIHVKIVRVGMGYRLIDQNSRNGTFVNGVRVLEHPLASFDTIEIGKSKIKFLIHDAFGHKNQEVGGSLVPIENTSSQLQRLEQTKSIMQMQREPEFLSEPIQEPPKTFQEKIKYFFQKENLREFTTKNRKNLVLGLVLLIGLLMLLPSGKKDLPKRGEPLKVPSTSKFANQSPELMDLTPELQRAVEGYYMSAKRAGDKDLYEEALVHLKRLHEIIPSYKDSKELQERYNRAIKEKQIQEAASIAQKDDKQDLQILLEEGLDYLKQGDFEKAGESFNSAITLDPNNKIAIQGLKAVEYKVRSLEEVPPDRDPEAEKKKQIADLFREALEAFQNKSYQLAIAKAEEVRKIEIRGDTSYLNQAKQIIDRAKMMQKEEFEPFLIQAKEKFAENDFVSSRELCEEMLKRDPAYDEAKECVLKAKKQLTKLAKEAYTHGYILESLNRLEEAKQYWNRAKNYVRPGDDYFDKIQKKLDNYQ